jgi:hypothetical protein
MGDVYKHIFYNWLMVKGSRSGHMIDGWAGYDAKLSIWNETHY